MEPAPKSWSRKLVDLTGRRFAHLTVIGRAQRDGRRTRWVCRCDCGRERTALGQNLKGGFTKCCGCGLSGRRRHHSKCPTRTRLYNIWSLMNDRCSNAASASFRHYGARGIRVCEEWQSYDAFYEWAMANGHAPDLTLDRIDNDGGYSPENCRWATTEQQGSNKRSNVYFDVGGVKMTLSQACRRFGVLTETVRQRMERGWSEQDLFNPAQPIRLLKRPESC